MMLQSGAKRHCLQNRSLATAFVSGGAVFSFGTAAIASDPLGIIQEVQTKLVSPGTLDGGADLDGDGVPDFVCAAVDATTLIDRLDAFSGATGLVLFSIPAADSSDPFPASLRIMGDVNADGVVDIVAGTGDNGYVRIVSGDSGAFLNTITGSILDNFGECVDGAGDFNGDGLADVVVATQHALPWGHVQVFSAMSSALLGTITPAQASLPYQAFRVAGLGDTNSDGFDDFAYSTNEVVVGNPNTVRGRVRVVHGPSGTEAFSLISGQALDDYAFYEGSLRTGGDVNSDGFGDILVGAVRFQNLADIPVGRVWIYSGNDGTPILECTPPAGTVAKSFGLAIDAIGDLDGDGKLDIIVGDSGGKDAGTTGINRGIVRTYSTANGALLKTMVGAHDDANLGGLVAPAGDINTNGTPDVLTTHWPDPANAKSAIIAVTSQCGGLLHYGTACPNANNFAPMLTVTSGCPSPGVPISIAIGGQPFAQTVALLVIGTATGSYALGAGCSLLVGGTTVVIPMTLSVFGTGNITTDIPLGFVQDVAIQAFLPAPGTALGYSATRAAFVQID